MTDLIAVSQQRDLEYLEWAIEKLEDEFEMTCPEIPDDKGRMRRAQIFLPDPLTVSELVDIVQSGAWPEAWTREGEWLRDLCGR